MAAGATAKPIVGVVTTWEERGAAYVSRQYIEALRSDFAVSVFARGGSDSSHGSALFRERDCYRSHGSTIIFSTYIRRGEFARWIRRLRPDIVFFNEQNWWPPVVWCKQWGLRTVAYVDYYTADTIPNFALYDVLICNTRRHMSAFDWHPGAVYIPWGTDTSLFSRRPRPLCGPVTFFHSCGMAPERKGTDLVVRAFGRLESGTARLIIHSQRPIASYVCSMLGCTEEDLGKRGITLVEETVSAPGLYHLGDVYVYPTRLEGIGLTIIEALACGLPVIVPDDGPMNEFVGPGCGTLVPVERFHARADGYYWPMNVVSLTALCEAMASYATDRERVVRESANARRYAEKQLDWRGRMPAVRRAFSDCLQRPPMSSECARARAIAIEKEERTAAGRAKRFVSEMDGWLRQIRRRP